MDVPADSLYKLREVYHGPSVLPALTTWGI